MKAIAKNATPAKKRLPVRSQTTAAIMAAGRMKSKILTTRMMMAIPMIRSSKSKANS